MLSCDSQLTSEDCPYLFEVCWEAANKVGGIYTVIKTKSAVTVSEFHDHYILCAPVKDRSYTEVERELEPAFLIQPIEQMRKMGLEVVFGRWLVAGHPQILLFDIASALKFLDSWRWEFTCSTGISFNRDDNELNDCVLFGFMVDLLLRNFRTCNGSSKIIAHFHEWLSGVAGVLLRKRNIDIATIFTTHATILGRHLCAGDVDFYNSLKHIDVDFEAGRRGIYPRYCIERAAAHSSDVFTTVSHITAFESEFLLKKKPDGVLPNGLCATKPSALHELQNLHELNKKKILEFIRGHFSGHYDFDIGNSLIFFTSGRYEYRNKGVDIFLESLSRLNDYLKHCNSALTVIVFIIMPAKTNNYNVETLRGQAVTRQLRESIDEIAAKVKDRLYEQSLKGVCIDESSLLDENDIVKLKRNMLNIKRSSLPPVVTHNMLDDAKDPILNNLRRLRLINNQYDKVKIVYHPEFLSAQNPILGLDYEDFVRGCHLGVFPSYYEPWGYTPAECTILGVPSVTTNLSGFGCYIEEYVECPAEHGVYIVDRRMKSVEESVIQLTDFMKGFCQKSRRQRINQRNRTERLSVFLDWNHLNSEYAKARSLAISRVYGSSGAEIVQNLSKIVRPLSAGPEANQSVI